MPFGTWAYRLNLFSLVCGTAAVALVYLSGRLLGFGRAAAMTGALVFGLAPEVLHEFLATEVFSLHLLWAALGAVLALGLAQPTSARGLSALGLWLGLGAGGHHTLALAAPAVAYAAYARGGWPKPRAIATGSCFFALGLAVYLLLPLRAVKDPPLDWGKPTTLSKVAHVFLRKDYGTLSLTVEGSGERDAASAAVQTGRFLKRTLQGLGAPAAALALFGLVAWRGSVPAAFPLLWLALAGPFFLALGNPPATAELEGALGRFHGLPWLAAAWAVASAAEAMSRRSRNLAWAALLAPLWLLGSRPAWAMRWNLMAYDYGAGVFKSLPRGAALSIDGGDDTFYTVAQSQFAEGRRPDVLAFDRGGLVFHSPYGPDFRGLPRELKEPRRREAERALAAQRPLFYSTMAESILEDRELLRVGLVQEAAPRGTLVGPGQLLWPFYGFRVDPSLVVHHYRHRALAPFFFFMKGWSYAELDQIDRALRCWRLAARLGPDVPWVRANVSRRLAMLGYRLSLRERWADAELVYAAWVQLYPSDAEAWTNLGASLEKMDRLDAAENADRIASSIDPRRADPYYNLGVIRWRQQRWSEAADAFAAALERRPGQAEWRKFLDQARRRAGRK